MQAAVQSGQLDVQEAQYCQSGNPISAVLDGTDRRIMLVLDPDNQSHLVGVITPFDVL